MQLTPPRGVDKELGFLRCWHKSRSEALGLQHGLKFSPGSSYTFVFIHSQGRITWFLPQGFFSAAGLITASHFSTSENKIQFNLGRKSTKAIRLSLSLEMQSDWRKELIFNSILITWRNNLLAQPGPGVPLADLCLPQPAPEAHSRHWPE